MSSIPPIQPTAITCVQCRYDLSGTPIGGTCPECGTPVADSIIRQRQDQTCGTAVTCMVVGILSLVVCAVLGPVAIALYYQARRDIERGGYGQGSMTMAKAGLITGIIGTVLIVFAVLVIVADELF